MITINLPQLPTESKSKSFPLGTEDVNEEDQVVRSAYRAILFMVNAIENIKSVMITVKSDIPVGAGLGSSAAFCVSVAGALYHFQRQSACTTFAGQTIAQMARNAECFFHGTSSGIDVFTSLNGGYVEVNSGHFTIEKLIKVYYKILIIDTGHPRSTKEMVHTVRSTLEKVMITLLLPIFII